ncbi:hypothetical protein CM19_00380 [Candidatus Acidianus copahuensis]|uniref:Uncharacterized protein n=1 Tax=Candidatus Acidianus copahuensis TaxID=1160895 RepID=A0A031LVV7_9CREN|nr:hypothetical protein [Candidatus Acidianus copahuensis]EZQ11920.1 hypothetical protein CM19_00380 [Candidatus Acidianus copahuensis]
MDEKTLCYIASLFPPYEDEEAVIFLRKNEFKVVVHNTDRKERIYLGKLTRGIIEFNEENSNLKLKIKIKNIRITICPKR